MNLGARRAAREARAMVGLLPDGPQAIQYGSDCGIPNETKIAAQTKTFLAGVEDTWRITTPGAFCPTRIYITMIDPPLDTFVTSIRMGLEEQVISGHFEGGQFPLVTRDLFSIANNCCPLICMPCICQPGVPLEVSFVSPISPVVATLVVFGVYLDASDPRYATLPDCPPDGGDKIVPFAATVVAGGTESVTIETPGRFCPRYMIIHNNQASDFNITFIKSGVKHQIISGTLPATLFTIANECCVLACFDCLCAPGYPLSIGFQNTDTEDPHTIFGALVGSYEDVCP